MKMDQKMKVVTEAASHVLESVCNSEGVFSRNTAICWDDEEDEEEDLNVNYRIPDTERSEIGDEGRLLCNKYQFLGRHKSFSLPPRWRSGGESMQLLTTKSATTSSSNDNETSAAFLMPSYVCPKEGSAHRKNVNPTEFQRRKKLMLKWFNEFNDEQRNLILMELLTRSNASQNHVLSVLLEPVLHHQCPQNCCDPMSGLPVSMILQIFSYLDPVSLCQCSRVCTSWRFFANQPILWQRFSKMSQWKLSVSAEQRQLQKHTTDDGIIEWKKVFSERFRLFRNWIRGYCHVRTFEGHTAGVSCVQFDDTRIVSGSSDKTVKVWNIRTNSLWPVMTLVGHSGTVRCLHLEGNRLVSGSTDCTIKVWDLSSHSGWSSIACKVTMVGHHDTVRCLQVDDEKVVSGSYDRTLKVWDLRTGNCKLTLRGHEGAVLCLQHDKNKIVSGSADKTIKVWNYLAGICVNTLHGHQDAVTCLQFDSWRIVSGSLDRTIKFWNLMSGRCLSTLDWMKSEGHTGVIRCLQADRWRIVSAGDDKTLKVWNLESGQRLVTLKNHTDGITCLQFNDNVIVSGSYDKTVKLWDFSVC